MQIATTNLIVFSGLPGTGKTTISKRLAVKLGATYIRIDSIEQAIKKSSLEPDDIGDAGYLVAYSLAEDNLTKGQSVISDSVNPNMVIRDKWVSVSKETNAKILEIEIICSNKDIHKQRIENRTPDIQNHNLPNWSEVMDLKYSKWTRNPLVIDTSQYEPDECIQIIESNLQ